MSAKERLDKLCEQYRQRPQDLPEEEVARLEAELWNAFQETTESLPVRRQWFRDQFGGSPSAYDARAALYSKNVASQPLWALLNAKAIPLTTAQGVLRQAKFLFRTTGSYDSLASAVNEAVAQWRSRPAVSQPPPPKETPASRSRRLLDNIMELVNEYVGEYGVDGDPQDLDAVQEFRGSVYIAIDEFRRGLSKTKAEIRAAEKVSLATARRAGEVLAMHIPTNIKPGEHARLRREVTRTKNSRLRELHPDLNGGRENEAIAKEIHAVKNASDVLRTYLTQQERKNAK